MRKHEQKWLAHDQRSDAEPQPRGGIDFMGCALAAISLWCLLMLVALYQL
jgi:hypothetical protein